MAMKFTIPGGTKYGSEAVPYIEWLVSSGVDASAINPAEDTVVTLDGETTTFSATALDNSRQVWIMNPVPEDVAKWLDAEFGPKLAPLDDIKVRLDKLRDARQRMSAAKDEAEELRAEILAILTARKAKIGTVDGVPVIEAKTIPQAGRLNRKALEAEYPTIVARFTGPDTTQTRLEFL
jgi:hypothetical protein